MENYYEDVDNHDNNNNNIDDKDDIFGKPWDKLMCVLTAVEVGGVGGACHLGAIHIVNMMMAVVVFDCHQYGKHFGF